jgi:hypothetical protein
MLLFISSKFAGNVRVKNIQGESGKELIGWSLFYANMILAEVEWNCDLTICA